MRRFTCEVCGAGLGFSADRCGSCGTPSGLVPALGRLLPLEVHEDARYSTPSVAGPTGSWWRCLNHSWGCNWMLPADAGDVWCRSCRLTRGRPDVERYEATALWARAETTKRRLVFQLLQLSLPVEPASSGAEHGLAFDFVHLTDGQATTGHREGIITLDLSEVDDHYRAAVQRGLGEADRTVLGHLRHEAGHAYWNLLVDQGGGIEAFRLLFGDERDDYAAALASHYDRPSDGVPSSHVSHYATSHPNEDWAETFGHCLAMLDALETADAFGAGATPPGGGRSPVERWRAMSPAINEINRALGHPAPYPFAIGDEVAAKLDFCHRSIRDHARLISA